MNKNCEHMSGGGIKSIEVLKEFKCSGCGDIFKRYVPLFNGGKIEICDSCELQKDREDKIDKIIKK